MNAMFKDNGKKDVTEDERSVDSDDDFQDPPLKKINEHSKKKQKVDSSTSVAKKPSEKKQVNIVDEHIQTRTPPPRAAKAAVMKTPVFKPITTRQASSLKTKKEKQTARVIFPQVQSKANSHVEEVVVSKRESHVEKEAFISKKVFDAFCEEMSCYQVLMHTEEKASRDIYWQGDEHFNDKKSESVVQDHCQHIDVCFYYLRKKSKYDPNRSYKFSTIDSNFMNIIRFIHDVYSADAANLTVGGQVAHLNEYINGFRMHVVVPWHTVEEIYIPVNIKEKHHWVLAILSFSERCIFLYDSYESSGHYSVVLDVIEKLAVIIPLYLQHCDFYVKNRIDVENHPRYKDKDSSDMFDVLFQESFPQQPSEILVLANKFDPNALRTRYAALLWEYGTIK
ncbi:hypothetical protein BC332_15380 [Capsicum chinense]|nr:hypothetical protein BC332_15380 [Capsicum chinense]